ncbi:MAG TPA: transketolase C-terminal domain-containing protein [Halalkalibaculum sp.]|nr:transketolase C-terminal domain-containing protein [Halalkalibaculum sp.]
MKKGMRETMVDVMMDEARAGTNLVVLVSDSTSTSKIKPFQEEFGDKVVNVGIAEQNLVGAAAGMALGGMVPITANAAPFLLNRSNEQVKNDICYSETNVKLVGLNPGFAYGALGPTHHSIDDISIMRGFGAISIFAPQDPRETAHLFRHVLHTEGPVYIRLDSISAENLTATAAGFQPGKLTVHRQGGQLVMLALGTSVHHCITAAETLQQEGIDTSVVGVSSIRPIDYDQLEQILSSHETVLTVEEHSVHGGLGSLVAELIAERQLGTRLKRSGIDEGTFAPASPADAIRTRYRLDADGIVASAKELAGKVKV